MYDSDKILTTEKLKKLIIWNKHFGDLAKDTTGNSRSAAKWRKLLSGDEDYFPECDDYIKWSEITKALNYTPYNKAPEVDGGNFTHTYDNQATRQDRGLETGRHGPQLQTDSQRTSSGVDVPGLPNQIPGLLFADDAVVLSDSAENLQTSLDTISTFSGSWEMAVDVSKCAIMAINCDDAVEMTLQWQTTRTTDNYT
ncbi:hypothetical protein AYI69_g7773 [Smittium culicis]|uniref:Reverse transcriptase domain-containing protein n=1 Tax=Smittium culicis TaxID=133412 RepID=A0A1R1XPN4_9FUNG|nr:hypothetical protein AYI69_g7773 [Smittium culicis]